MRPRGRLRTGPVEFEFGSTKCYFLGRAFDVANRAFFQDSLVFQGRHRELAVLYAQKRDQDLEKELACGELEEICDDDKGQVQE